MIHTKEKSYTIYNASCLDVMDSMEENLIDCIVTDPPYHLQSIVKRFGKEGSAPATTKNNDGSFSRLSKGFMGMEWDGGDIAFRKETWEKALRVLKPGGYLLAFNHSRTFHRMMVAIEDAGFELRDTILWLYGSGFPKSHNISKAIDKKMGVESEMIGKGKSGKSSHAFQGEETTTAGEYEITIPTSSEGKRYAGYGTALKPAFEPIVMARKPFKSSVAENVLKYGVGGINIDECRIGNEIIITNGKGKQNGITPIVPQNLDFIGETHTGRFPANIIHDGSEEACSGFPDTTPSTSGGLSSGRNFGQSFENNDTKNMLRTGHNDNGGSASRYFYTAKASVKDRDEGLSEFEIKLTGELQGGRKEGSAGSIMRDENGERLNPYAGSGAVRKNMHPTVKPTDLMQYLIRLVAPKGSTVLDIFMGSGSTGKACMIENTERNADYHFIGIDLEKEYCDIAKARIEWGINFRELENKRVVYDDNGNENKAVQEKFDLF